MEEFFIMFRLKDGNELSASVKLPPNPSEQELEPIYQQEEQIQKFFNDDHNKIKLVSEGCGYGYLMINNRKHSYDPGGISLQQLFEWCELGQSKVLSMSRC